MRDLTANFSQTHQPLHLRKQTTMKSINPLCVILKELTLCGLYLIFSAPRSGHLLLQRVSSKGDLLKLLTLRHINPLFSNYSFPFIVRSYLYYFGVTATIVVSAPAQRVGIEVIGGKGANIFADGNNLLENGAGAGFYVIGSDDDSDDGDNISSHSKSSKNGVMFPLNPIYKEPYCPYNFILAKDSNNPRRLNFSVSVAPAKFNFTTISVPLDGRKQRFTHWRYEGSGIPKRYDSNPPNYTPPGLPQTNIAKATGQPKWGEMIGPDYTVRYTVTSRSRNLGLFFVNSPGLGGGVNNVEFSFGGVSKGQTASMSGYIEVFLSDPALFFQPAVQFQCESHNYHQIGRKDGSGWSVRVGDAPNRFMNYGPYTSDIVAGERTATFALMIDNTSTNNAKILKIEVFDSASGRTLNSRDILRKEFTSGPMRYQNFSLNFSASAGQRLEFRTYWYGGAYCRQDFTAVR